MMRLPITSSLVLFAAHVLAIVTIAVVGASSYDVTSLTPDNYNELTEGKTVFLKFFAPWCGHCKKMAPDWERLAEDYDKHEVGLVAEVDCTSSAKELCDANNVRGFPTLKYGDPSNLEDYQGSRSYEDLAEFAKEHLEPICSVSNMELCTDEKKGQIGAYLAMSVGELQASIVKEEEKLEQAEKAFQDAVAKLQAEYQKISEEKDVAVSAIKDSGLALMRSVFTAKSKDETTKNTDEL